MRHVDFKEKLQKEYNQNISYNYWISALLAQGQHHCVSDFLEKVTNFEKKGGYDDLYHIE